MKQYSLADAFTAAYLMRRWGVRVLVRYHSRAVGREIVVTATVGQLLDIARGNIFPPDFYKGFIVPADGMHMLESLDKPVRDAMRVLGLWPEEKEEEAAA